MDKQVPIWIVSIMMAIIMALGGYLYTDLKANEKIYWERVERRFEIIEARMLNAQIENDTVRRDGFSRLAVVESSYIAINLRLTNIEARLQLLLDRR
mgnify:CR=1 FL=1